jgi:tripartite-type tricarboxylate transporter receptor subunit TctC
MEVIMSRKFQIILLAIAVVAFSVAPSFAKQFPERPITLVVGFGVGGSADRMTRSTSSFLSDALGVPVKVVNKKGAGTMLGAKYVLRQPKDGYTLFASTFAPYMTNTIISGGANYKIDDFAFINGQWFDFDLIALHKDSPYNSLAEVLKVIKENPKKISCSVVQGSSGHLMIRLLLKKYDIPFDNLNLVTYNSGGKARAAAAGGQADLISISAEGSEGIKEFLKPLAVVRNKPSEKWDAPIINDALKPLGITVPVMDGSIRGYAVPAEVKEKYPERFEYLVKAFEKTLTDKDVKKFLKRTQIGAEWTGPEKMQNLMRENFALFQEFSDLLK